MNLNSHALQCLAVWLLIAVTACQSPSKSTDPPPTPPPARLASIAMTAPDGTVIVLADRSTWAIDPDHRQIASKWRPADLIEAVRRSRSNGESYPDILTNQETGSSIRARQSSDFEG